MFTLYVFIDYSTWWDLNYTLLCGTQVLLKRFTDFMHDLMASEERVLSVSRMAESMVKANHSGM